MMEFAACSTGLQCCFTSALPLVLFRNGILWRKLRSIFHPIGYRVSEIFLVAMHGYEGLRELTWEE